MSKLPRVLRIARGENPEARHHNRPEGVPEGYVQGRDGVWSLRIAFGGEDHHRAVHGSPREGTYALPTPHADQQVHLGGNPHRDLYRDYSSRPATLSEQLDAMVIRSKT